MRSTALAAVMLAAVLAGCGEYTPLTPSEVASQSGCQDPQPTESGYDEVTCALGGEEVTITDWGDDTDGLHEYLALLADSGYHFLAVTDRVTAGAEDRAVLEKIRAEVGGEWVPGG